MISSISFSYTVIEVSSMGARFLEKTRAVGYDIKSSGLLWTKMFTRVSHFSTFLKNLYATNGSPLRETSKDTNNSFCQNQFTDLVKFLLESSRPPTRPADQKSSFSELILAHLVHTCSYLCPLEICLKDYWMYNLKRALVHKLWTTNS